MGKKHYILLVLLLLPLAHAMEGHMPLLALLTKDNQNKGIIAGLDLKIIPGEEKVFLQTFPMTQVSTQVSMRFAKQIACEEYDLDCSKYDFLYTITSVPGVIGGPSAGASAAVLTAAVLMDKKVDETISITGTINSGGIIGPVGGIDKKIEAAAENGIKEVLIPLGMKEYEAEGNLTINLEELGRDSGIKVTEVGTLEEAAQLVAGIEPIKKSALLKIDEKYLDKMKSIAEKLCKRTELMKEEAGEEVVEGNYTAKAEESFKQEDYYSAASYCFRANVDLRKKIFANYTEEELGKILDKIKYVLDRQKEAIEKTQIRTLTDIETYMAVMERIEEAALLIENAKLDLAKASDIIALATERIFSANVWAEFFDMTYDTRIIINGEEIKESCSAKISEAEERVNYVKVSFKAIEMGTLQEGLENAYAAMNSGDNIMCLYKASKVKAESDILLALKGLNDANFNKTMELKFKAAQESIAKNLKKGSFPIIAYSYYEYAKNLFKFREPISALFAEYALELASIDMYFKEPTNSAITVEKGEDFIDEKEREKQEYWWRVAVTVFFIFVLILIWVAYEIGSRRRDKKIKAMIAKQRRKKKIRRTVKK